MINLQVLHIEIWDNSFEPILLTIGSLKCCLIDLKLQKTGSVQNLNCCHLQENARANTSIKSLTLYGRFTTIQLQFIFKIFKNIENLHVRFRLMCGCQNHESHTFNKNYYVTECLSCVQNWVRLLSSFSHLKQLSINYYHINDLFLQTIPLLNQLELIEFVKLSFCCGSNCVKREYIVSLLNSFAQLIQNQEPKKFYILFEAKMFKEYRNICESVFFNPNLIVRQTMRH